MAYQITHVQFSCVFCQKFSIHCSVLHLRIIQYFLFFYSHSSYGVELFNFSLDLYTIGRTPWMSDRPQKASTLIQNNTNTEKRAHTPNIHALSGIRTHDHSVRASEDSSGLRLLGHCDRHYSIYCIYSKYI
jgi:hypothetical protein